MKSADRYLDQAQLFSRLSQEAELDEARLAYRDLAAGYRSLAQKAAAYEAVFGPLPGRDENDRTPDMTGGAPGS